MVKRNSLFEPPAVRAVEPNTPRQSAYGYLIRSRALEFREDVLHVQRAYTENQKSPTTLYDFGKRYLPPNKLHSKVTLLKDRPDLARIVVAVVDSYVLRQQFTKSTALTAVTLAGNVTRFLEYCWLNEIYSLKNVKQAHWDTFFHKYVTGGWPLVLELERRSAEIDLRTLRLTRRRQLVGVIQYSPMALLEAIGSNLDVAQVRLEYKRGDTTGILRRAKGKGNLSESAVAAVASHLNNLADLPSDMRVDCVAHTNPYKFATSMQAIPPNRTENLEPRLLAALVAEAYRWVATYSKFIVPLTLKVYGETRDTPADEIDELRILILLEAPETKALELALGSGVRITSVARMGDGKKNYGLVALIRMLMASCFTLIAIFNARRKEEIQSKSIGLYADAFRCLDEELGLYESQFYCEKTTKDYVPFYVNEITFKALNVAKAISDMAWQAIEERTGSAAQERARKIFCWPARGRESYPSWYEYSSDPGMQLLVDRATGDVSSIVPNAHTFRRAYAVVFHYRYENTDLFALSQQLDHRDLNMTIHYLLDTASRVLEHHAARLWGDGDQTKIERARIAAELSAEISSYSKIKLRDDILEILGTKTRVAGGFVRLVNRFYKKMYGRIQYDDDDLVEAAKEISDVLISRGHSVEPMPHGNCNAGKPKSGAGCYRRGRLAKELASPKVCAGCPYHSAKATHVQAISLDLKVQKEYLASATGGSLLSEDVKESLEATERLVSFYTKFFSIDSLPKA